MKTKNARGGKLCKSEVIGVRLDQRLRYLAEVAARQHRRSLSAYIEYALSQVIDAEPLKIPGSDVVTTIGAEAVHLWDVDANDRLKKLAARFPHLLNFDEQVKLKAADGPR